MIIFAGLGCLRERSRAGVVPLDGNKSGSLAMQVLRPQDGGQSNQAGLLPLGRDRRKVQQDYLVVPFPSIDQFAERTLQVIERFGVISRRSWLRR
jgi:hypothetical protein